MTRLSVNLNKVALLRNSRHTGVPDLLEFARVAIEAGAGALPSILAPTNGTSAATTYRNWPQSCNPSDHRLSSMLRATLTRDFSRLQ